MFKRILIIIGLILVSSQLVAITAQATLSIENVQVFGSEPAAHDQSKGKSLTQCLSGFSNLISSFSMGMEDFSDYWRDILLGLLHPMYYADIANVEEQLNKSRYAVMMAFLRCDVDRLSSVTNAYYKLEAELYFLRHYVDVSGGSVLNFAEAGKTGFINEMTDYFWLRKKGKKEEDKAMFAGYFEMFIGKYRTRAKMYGSYGNDPIYSGLGDRFDALIKSFKDFGKASAGLGTDIGEVATETYSAAKSAANTAVSAFQHPGKALVDATTNIFDRFQICPDTGSPDDCIKRSQLNPFDTSTGKKTFSEVMVAIAQQDTIKKEMADKGEMLARYEVLYGQVGGSGMRALIFGMDKLIDNISTQSAAPLNKIKQCADYVKGSMCSKMF